MAARGFRKNYHIPAPQIRPDPEIPICFALFIANYFQVTGNFETSALNGPKMTFYTTISKMPTM